MCGVDDVGVDTEEEAAAAEGACDGDGDGEEEELLREVIITFCCPREEGGTRVAG